METYLLAGTLYCQDCGESQQDAEWECPECTRQGTYADIRKPIDHGVDSCPECGTEVKANR